MRRSCPRGLAPPAAALALGTCGGSRSGRRLRDEGATKEGGRERPGRQRESAPPPPRVGCAGEAELESQAEAAAFSSAAAVAMATRALAIPSDIQTRPPPARGCCPVGGNCALRTRTPTQGPAARSP